MNTKKQPESCSTENRTTSKITSCRESEQEIDITMDEIEAQNKATNDSEVVSDEEIKAATEQINPDEGSMNSRG